MPLASCMPGLADERWNPVSERQSSRHSSLQKVSCPRRRSDLHFSAVCSQTRHVMVARRCSMGGHTR
jgi:hypothetical protein